MKLYGTLEGILEYSAEQRLDYFSLSEIEHSKKSNEHDKLDSLQELLLEKVSCLSDILNQIEHDIRSRKFLSENVISLIYIHYCYLKTKLFKLYSWEFGRFRNIEHRRSRLEQQLDRLKQEKRQEQVKCWQDIAFLKKESRQWFKEYCDLMQRTKIILSENAKFKR